MSENSMLSSPSTSKELLREAQEQRQQGADDSCTPGSLIDVSVLAEIVL
jgi:hypothetical protein